MKLLTSIIAVLGIIITIALTITPVGNLTIFPAIITILCGVILYKIYKKDGNNTVFPKFIIGIAILGVLISSGKALLTTDKVADDQKFKQRQEKSNQENVEDLEGLE